MLFGKRVRQVRQDSGSLWQSHFPEAVMLLRSVLAWRSQHKQWLLRLSQCHCVILFHDPMAILMILTDCRWLQRVAEAFKHATLMSKSALGRASILPKIIQWKEHLRVFLHLSWQPTVYMWRTHWKRTRMSRKRLLLLDAWMSLPEKSVFARSNSSGTCVPVCTHLFRSSSTGSTG